MEVLGRKLEMELPDESRVIACRFPFPGWSPTATEGEGLDQAWAYDMNAIRKLSTHATMKWGEKHLSLCQKALFFVWAPPERYLLEDNIYKYTKLNAKYKAYNN